MSHLSKYRLDDITKRLEHYCSYQERCHQDVEHKLREYKLIPEAKEKILLHLIQHNFLNETRFAQNFARGKFRIKQWGKVRIIRELKARDISIYNIDGALKEIKDDEYLAVFHSLAEKKFAALTDPNANHKKQKLLNYLRYRGWETHLIFDKINELFS